MLNPASLYAMQGSVFLDSLLNLYSILRQKILDIWVCFSWKN
jgi:hypothetical protein